MKQLTREEAQFHVKLSDRYDPIYVCRNAHAYLLTPCTEEGWVPVTCYPRFDFFILGLNQLVNHLDKMQDMSKGDMKPKVIIRVAVGSKVPFSAGPQHTQNHTEAIRQMLTEVEVVELIEPDQIFEAFKTAYEREDGKSTLIIEHSEYYGTK